MPADVRETMGPLGTLTDSTESRRVDQARSGTKRRGEETVALGVWEFDLASRIVELDDSARTILGVSADERATPALIWALLHPEDAGRVRESVRRAFKVGGSGSLESEHRIVRRDGGVRWVIVRARMVRDVPAAGARRALGVLLDITEQKNVANASHRNAEILKAVTDATAEIIFVKDRDERYLFANPAFCMLVGIREEKILGRTEEELFSNRPTEERLCRSDAAVWSTGTPSAFEQVINVHGEERIFWSTQSPYRDEHGEIVGVIGVVRDITENTRVERELTAHRERLTDLVNEKTAELAESERRLRFADRMATMGTLSAGIGHDLGNLLLPIRARLDVLNARAHDEITRQDLEAIRVATDYLRRLTNGLRNLSANAETYSVGSGTVQVGEWWADAEPLLKNAVPPEVTIFVDIPTSGPAVHISHAVLTQAALNLVQNAGEAIHAAKRTNPRIGIRYHVREGGREVELEVTDNGPGMPEEVKARCLEPFFSTKARSFSSGLGLSLVHGAVTAAGGRVEIDSQVGIGTTFRLILPVAKSAGAKSRRTREERPLVCVSMRDARRRAHVKSVLTSLKLRPRESVATLTDPHVRLWVTDGENTLPEDVLRFVKECSTCHAMILAESSLGVTHERVVELRLPAPPADVRAALQRVAAVLTGEGSTGAKPHTGDGQPSERRNRSHRR
ncbi:MAG: PAS domain S-box protein [Gemmatimonadaceae bacterium]